MPSRLLGVPRARLGLETARVSHVADVIDGCKWRGTDGREETVASCAGDAEAKRGTSTATDRKVTGLLALAGLP